MLPIPEVSDADIAFGAKGAQITPAWDDIPDQYKHRHTKGVELFEDIFFGFADTATIRLIPKDGVDPEHAWRALQTVMHTFETAHERKTAGWAYLFHEWFADASWQRKDGIERTFDK